MDSKKYERMKLKADIDCANCAREVEEALNAHDGVKNAHFDFPKKEITLDTCLSKDDIKAIARDAEDEIIFPEDEFHSYKFSVEIDCADCARKVEEALAKHKGVKKVQLNYPKKELTIETTLSTAEVKNIAKEIEDDIIFIENEFHSYRFKIEIDCADCARKVEEALAKHEGVKNVHLNYPKKELTIETTLSTAEVKSIAKEAEDEIVFVEDLSSKNRKNWSLIRILSAAIIFAIAMLSGYKWIAIISYFVAGYDVLWKALKNIFKGKIFDENFLMTIATIGALFIASYDEAAGVMIFYQVGEYFQDKATRKSQSNIAKLMDLKADTAEVERNGQFVTVRSEDVKPGETIRIKAGEKIPVDATVINGESFINTKALTGESVPRKVMAGTDVLSGSINGDGTLICKATAPYAESTATKIIKLVDESEAKKSKSEKFISKFSKYYTPAVCATAAVIAVFTPLLLNVSFKESLYRACMLLVISCPCALVLSVPLTYFASMGSFAKRGILVKSDETIQNMAKLDLLALDKTGTLTEGVFSVQSLCFSEDDDKLIHLAASLEKNSSHPIAKAILSYAGSNWEKAENVREIPGIGIEGIINGKLIKAGSKKIIEGNAPIPDGIGTHVYVTEDNKLIGIIVISDRLKDSSIDAVREMKKAGIKEVWMLSGDRKEIAEATARDAGLDDAMGELLPQDKISAFEKLMEKGRITGYAGDGINDAPVLKRADIGFAMGGVGSDAAIEAADAVIMNDDLMKIPTAVRIAKKTESIVKENIIISLIVKAIVFIFALFGFANMWLAVIADTGVTLLAVMNAMRALRWENKQ